MKILKVLLVLAVLAVLAVLGGLGGVGFLYSGLYPMGADVPHNRLTYWVLEILRERSIAARIKDIEVPPLDDSNLLLAGGADYNDMCAGCHLKPGKSESEISLGLYPQPPNLASSASEHGHGDGEAGDPHGDAKTSAARQFWIIKHGIKDSGMAAFGRTHGDERIWAMVAFLRKLPTLTPVQYQILTARAPGEAGHGAHVGMEGMISEGMQKPASSDSGGHVDPPGAKSQSHGGQAAQSDGRSTHR